MEWTVKSFVEARDAVDELLQALDLEAFGFEVEPRGEVWEVRIECPVSEGWKMLTLTIDASLLAATRRDAAARRQVLNSWRERLRPCKHTPTSIHPSSP